MTERAPLATAWLLLALALSGCFTGRYLSQAARGQLDLLRRARPIDQVAFDRRTDEQRAQLLLSVARVKRFGRSRGLAPTDNYQQYADLQRPACVWVVSACDGLSFTPRRWRFPISGAVPYLGWFDPKDAQAFADELRADPSLDVDVRTASAYSTLGWFKDPVLSTMLGEGDEAAGDLAEVVLHESVHATVYVPDQSSFNESLASFVAERLTRSYLERRYGPEAKQTTAWLEQQRRSTERVARLHQAYLALDAVYRSADSDQHKREQKAALLGELATELRARRPLNNATLVSYQTYDTSGPAFARLLEACGGHVWRLLEAVKRLRTADFGSAHQDDLDSVLRPLTERGCR